MLASIRYCLRTRQSERAAELCDSVIADFQSLVRDAESDPDDLPEEDRIALEYLVEAIGVAVEIRGTTPELGELRERSVRLLSRE